jgi:hypothetical protein
MAGFLWAGGLHSRDKGLGSRVSSPEGAPARAGRACVRRLRGGRAEALLSGLAGPTRPDTPSRWRRGQPPDGADAGVDFVAYGGAARVERVEAWEVGSIWERHVPLADAAIGDVLSSYKELYEPLAPAVPLVSPAGSPVAV